MIIIIKININYCWDFFSVINCLLHQSFGLPMEVANNNVKQKIIVLFEYCRMPPKVDIETTSLFQRGQVQQLSHDHD